MSPRPILKSLPTAPPKLAKPSFRAGRGVHFPPTPDLSATYLTHSGRSYDRSAIVVSPNECALPQRNCPDRTYILSEGKGEAHLLKSVEPGGVQADDEDAEDTPAAELDPAAQRADYFSVTPPSLTPDMTSSESDDSDGLMSPPNEVEHGHSLPSIPILNFPKSDTTHAYDASPSPEDVKAALAFLPHPLPPARERKRSPSPHDRDRRKERANSFSGTENGIIPPAPRRRVLSFTPQAPPDSGCLGGF